MQRSPNALSYSKAYILARDTCRLVATPFAAQAKADALAWLGARGAGVPGCPGGWSRVPRALASQSCSWRRRPTLGPSNPAVLVAPRGGHLDSRHENGLVLPKPSPDFANHEHQLTVELAMGEGRPVCARRRAAVHP